MTAICSHYYLLKCSFHGDIKISFQKNRSFQLEALYLDIHISGFCDSEGPNHNGTSFSDRSMKIDIINVCCTKNCVLLF